jgi:hypothetical protein
VEVEGRVECGVRKGVVREGLYIGGGRASGGAGRWRRPTTARGLASSCGAVMTSAGWRRQGGSRGGEGSVRGARETIEASASRVLALSLAR